MSAKKLGLLGAAVSLFLGLLALTLGAQTRSTGSVKIDEDDIGGVVRSSKGPEAGVWVIAETNDLPTRFTRIVITDDQGRYVIPDLPKGNFTVFVRGYGLIDSKRVPATPGKQLNLTAALAPSPIAAAQYYPANYWLSLLRIPPKSAFPMGRFRTQLDMLNSIKGAILLEQVGDKASREIPEKLGKFNSSRKAWEAWQDSGELPAREIGKMTPQELDIFANWTDRIRAGEGPPPPPRPEGLERNLVITEWDWSDEIGFIHDDVATDKNDPRVNANGLILGVEQHSRDVIDALDPNTGKAWQISFPVTDPDMPVSADAFHWTKAPVTWGDRVVKGGKASLHNPMFDHLGRLWITAQFREGKQPEFCTDGSVLPSAKFFPLPHNMANGDTNGREVAYYDPKTKQFTDVNTCFGTHHLEFANDADHTLWTSGGEDTIGWVDTKKWDETHDPAQSQGWCPYIVDTNGNGKPDPGWVEPPTRRPGEYGPSSINNPVEPGKDLRIHAVAYGLSANSPDGSIWQAVVSGYILRISPGPNPPYTCLTEIYRPPANAFATGPKGIDVDRKTGLVWVAFAHSGTFASFDRNKCRVLNGPTALGDHCPEGWSFYPTPGPRFEGVTDPVNTDYHYLNWVDQFNVFGLGENIPFAPGTNSDSMIAFLPNERKFLVFRVPYPMGFYARGVDGRIDNPQEGWKGRGLWSTYASIAPWTYEGGKGAKNKVVKLQLRPDPLAN